MTYMPNTPAFTPSEFTLNMEVAANSEGILYNPITVGDITILELGLFTIQMGSSVLKLWVIPQSESDPVSKDSYIKLERWIIRSNFNDFRDEIYFTGFDVKTMCDEDCNETIGEAVVGRNSRHQARIFTDYDKAYKALNVLNVINHEAKWIIVPIDC